MKSFVRLLADLLAIGWTLLTAPSELSSKPTEIVKLLLDNLRILVTFVIAFFLLLYLLAKLGNPEMANSPNFSSAVAIATVLVTSALYVLSVLLVGWFGLAIALPEANRFLLSKEFDVWFFGANRGYIALVAAGVIGLIGAVCLLAAASPPAPPKAPASVVYAES